MTAAVTVDVTLTEHQLAKLEFALAPVALLGWLESVMQPYIRDRARKRFAGEGDDVVGKWRALADSTKEIRTTGQVDYGSGPINVRTGQLERYITDSHGDFVSTDGVAQMTYPPNPNSRSLEEKMIAAQQGLVSTPLPNGGTGGPTPARPVIGINERDLAFALTSLERYVMGLA